MLLRCHCCSAMNVPILVVDDEPDMCWAIAHLLKSQGFNVITASNGADACFKLANGDFSVVFLDAKLPDMDGLEVARRAITMATGRPSIVLVSGYHYQDDPVVHDALTEGIICTFLAKPFTNEALLKTLYSLLPTDR